MKIDIKEFEQVQTIKFKSIEIFVLGIVLNTNARLGVRIFDVDGKPVDSRQLTLEGEDYEKWGNDDQYIVDYVCNKYGFIRELGETPVRTPPPEN